MPGPESEPGTPIGLLRVDDVSKVFSGNLYALRNVSFEVHEAEFVSIVGPSGCGKTTLLRLIAGLDQPTRGSIWFDAALVNRPGPDRGMVFQKYTSFPWLTVEQNVAFGLRASGRDQTPRSDLVTRLLDQVGLAEFRDAYPGTLSGGMQQRLALARTLAVEPRILLLDEPFGALDAQTRADMQLLLLRLFMKSHQTILFVTHDIEEALFLGQRLMISGPRPFAIRRDMAIPFGQHRNLDLKTSPVFAALEEQVTIELRRLMHIEAQTYRSDPDPKSRQR